MSNIKIPLSPMWRLFEFEGEGDLTYFVWNHAGRPNLSVAEAYILDVMSLCPVEVEDGVMCWCFANDRVVALCALLVDAQEDEDLAVFTAWCCWDVSLVRPKLDTFAGPDRKGAAHAA